MSTPSNMSFEQAYEQLAHIVQRLENEDLALDDALALFEQGQQLAAYCQQLLDSAELRISRLLEDDVDSEA